MFYDNRKEDRYYFVIQWKALPDFGISLTGPKRLDGVAILNNMEEQFGDYSNNHDTLTRKLVAKPWYIKHLTKKSKVLRYFCLNQTKFKDLVFDDDFNNIILFEGMYFPKAYLKDWKIKNKLTFSLLISDMNQFSSYSRFKIQVGGFDRVLSFFDPPSSFTNLVDLVCEIPAPLFTKSELNQKIFKENKNWLSGLPRDIDISFSASSTTVRDKLILPFCNCAIKHGLSKYFVYSNLQTNISQFPFLKNDFPDETGFLDPFQNNYLISRSNCIIEICKSKALAVTDRYRKAIVYNKKYITNNPAIKDLPFFNPKWMKIIKSEQDITADLMDWIKTKEAIDYNYDGRWEFRKTVLEPLSQTLRQNTSLSIG